jgi:hypothetical protein
MEAHQISQSPVNLSISHVSVATGLRFDRLTAAFEGSLGKWDPIAGESLAKERVSWPKVEAAVARPSSFLAALNQPELDAIGKSLDEKLDRVISNLSHQTKL